TEQIKGTSEEITSWLNGKCLSAKCNQHSAFFHARNERSRLLGTEDEDDSHPSKVLVDTFCNDFQHRLFPISCFSERLGTGRVFRSSRLPLDLAITKHAGHSSI